MRGREKNKEREDMLEGETEPESDKNVARVQTSRKERERERESSHKISPTTLRGPSTSETSWRPSRSILFQVCSTPDPKIRKKVFPAR